MDSILLRNALTDLGESDVRRVDLLIDEGKILSIGKHLSAPGSQTVDCTNFMVVPGMINSHYHSNGNFDRGIWDNLPLEPYGLFAFPRLMTPMLSSRELYIRTLLGGLEQLKSGVTCTIDFLSDPHGFTPDSLGSVVQAYRDLGLRAVIVLSMNDRPYHETVLIDLAKVDADLVDLMDREKPSTWDHWETVARRAVAMFHRPEEGISIGLAPGAPERCTDEFLRGCARLAEELDLVVHTHALETRMQAVIAGERFGKSLPAHLEELGFLSGRLSIQHGVWLSDEDVKLLAKHEVTVVHNPLSNMKLGSGMCPIPLMRHHGVHLALGTDAMSCNDGCNMLETVKVAAVFHKLWDVDFKDWSGARDAWRMATTGGARSAGDPQRLGRIAQGAWADLLLLDLHSSGFSPLNEPINQLVLGAPYESVHSVMIQGRWVLRNGDAIGVDERSVLEEGRQIGSALSDRRAASGSVAKRLVDAVCCGWRAARERYEGPSRYMCLGLDP